MPFERVLDVSLAEFGLHGRPQLRPADVDGDGRAEAILWTSAREKVDRSVPGTNAEYGEDLLVAVDRSGEVRWTADTGRDFTHAHRNGGGGNEGGTGGNSVTAGAIDDDGRDEVVQGLSDGNSTTGAEAGVLQLVDHDGESVWVRDDYYGVESVTAADVDGDGTPEIVVAWKLNEQGIRPHGGIRAPHFPVGGSVFGKYVVYRADGSVVFERCVGPTAVPDTHAYATGIAPGRFNHHTGLDMGVHTTDLDGDGRAEILAPSGDRDAFRVLAHDGTDDGTVRLTIPYGNWHGDDLVWGDFDEDGRTELVILNGHGDLQSVTVDGDHVWSATFGDHLQFLDLARDGSDRPVLHVGEKAESTVYRVDPADGGRLGAIDLARARAGDLDDDGRDELVRVADGRVELHDVNGRPIESGPFCNFATIATFGEDGADTPGDPRLVIRDGHSIGVYRYAP